MLCTTCRRIFSGNVAVLPTTASATSFKASSLLLEPAIWLNKSSTPPSIRIGELCKTGLTWMSGVAGTAGSSAGAALSGSTGVAGTPVASGGIIRVALPGVASSGSQELDDVVGASWGMTGFIIVVSAASDALLPASAGGAARCSIVGWPVNMDCWDCAVGAGACLFAIWLLSASLRIPVSQSGSSPTELLATPGIETWGDAGNCDDAGGGTMDGILLALNAIVAASWIDDCCCCCANGADG